MKRYPEYKDSGVVWLGSVPLHWKVERFKWLIERNDGGVWGEDPDGTDDIVVLRSTEQTVDGRWQIDQPAKRKLGEKDRVSALLAVGDLLVTKSSGSALHIGKTTLVDEYVADLGACYSNFMQRLRLADVLFPQIAWYILNNDLARVQLDLASNSTTGLANLNGSVIGELLLALPPREEQAAIGAFLDRETAKIDALIAEQETLIALLAEKRQATISHAVTRGLDADAPMKDSGVAWLGEVPAHWDSGTLKRFAAVIDCRHHTVAFLDDGLPIVSIREVRDNRIDLSNAKRTSIKEWDFLREGRLPEPGDLIFCRNASVGAVGYVDSELAPFCMGQDVCLIRPHTKSRFMHYLLMSRTASDQIEALLVGATIRRVNVEEIRNLVAAWPPEEEQSRIASFLDAETSKLHALTAEAERTVTLLNERRSALIAAAVTGQIDVRSATAATTARDGQLEAA